MTTVKTLAEDLNNILQSFSSILEGVYHIDEDLAAELADKFSARLHDTARAIYADMTAEISEGLKKPPKKRKRRNKIVEPEAIEQPDRAIGAEEFPVQENTLLNVLDSGDVDLLSDRLLKTERITSRAGNPNTSNTSSWDTDNPTMRRIGK